MAGVRVAFDCCHVIGQVSLVVYSVEEACCFGFMLLFVVLCVVWRFLFFIREKEEFVRRVLCLSMSLCGLVY